MKHPRGWGHERAVRARMLRIRRRQLLEMAAGHLGAAVACGTVRYRLPSNEDPIKAELHRIKRLVCLKMMRSLDVSSAVEWGIRQAKLAARAYNERQKEIWGAMQKKDWRSGCCGFQTEDLDLEFYHLRNLERLIARNAAVEAAQQTRVSSISKIA